MFDDYRKYKIPETSGARLSEDYILRIINQAAAVLAEIFGLKSAGRYLEAQQLVDQNLEILLGLESRLVRQLDDDSLLEALKRGGRLDLDRLAIVADLFKEDGDILLAQSQVAESRRSYLRALNLQLEAGLAERQPPAQDHTAKIDALVEALPGQDLYPDALYTLFCYDEKSGNFKRAEKSIKALLENSDNPDEVLPEYIDFYQRLLEKSDQELENGGYSRQKILQQLQALEKGTSA